MSSVWRRSSPKPSGRSLGLRRRTGSRSTIDTVCPDGPEPDSSPPPPHAAVGRPTTTANATATTNRCRVMPNPPVSRPTLPGSCPTSLPAGADGVLPHRVVAGGPEHGGDLGRRAVVADLELRLGVARRRRSRRARCATRPTSSVTPRRKSPSRNAAGSRVDRRDADVGQAQAQGAQELHELGVGHRVGRLVAAGRRPQPGQGDASPRTATSAAAGPRRGRPRASTSDRQSGSRPSRAPMPSAAHARPPPPGRARPGASRSCASCP